MTTTTSTIDSATSSAALARRLGAILREGEGAGEAGWDFQRLIAPALFEEMNRSRAFSPIVPCAYGGGGADPREVLTLLEAVSYESLPLGLVFGINIALFLQPLAKYGAEALKKDVFGRFMGAGALGGLMLTEPDYGTDLLSMQTCWRLEEGKYSVKGTKHWAGLSGRADFWLMSAREKKADGSLKRDIDFFVCDSSQGGQKVLLEGPYPTLGLHLIPYGRNRVDLDLPLGNKLEGSGSGVRLLLDLLHRSRLSFGGMAVGFLHRVFDDALAGSRERRVGGKSLLAYDQVERRLAEIQAAHTIAAAFCGDALGHIALENDLSGQGLLANIHKAVLTDLMQESAQSYLQLSGGNGYRLDGRAGRAAVDSRPFQIFEGSNDVLYDQVALAFIAGLKTAGRVPLAAFLAGHELTRRAAERFADLLDFTLDDRPPQRFQVDLGRLLGRLVAADRVLRLGESGYGSKLVENALLFLRSEAARLVSTLRGGKDLHVVEGGEGRPSWQDCSR
ncbi:MAG: acyl-CoA dehydrogenase family protein [Spirochaetota bacterium]